FYSRGDVRLGNPSTLTGGQTEGAKPIGTRPRRRFGASAASNEGEGLGAAHLVEKVGDRGGLDVALNEGLAYAPRENEGQGTSNDLLVLRNGVHENLRPGQFAGDVGKPCRQSGSLEVSGNAARVLARRQPELGRESMCEHHAYGDALAVQQAVGESGRRLERVPEGVAAVQQRADACFLLGGEPETRPGRAGAGHGLGARRAAREDVATIVFQPEEEWLVVDEPVFDNLGIAGSELPRRQRLERLEIGEYELGLMEGADQVLAVGRIDPGLAP